MHEIFFRNLYLTSSTQFLQRNGIDAEARQGGMDCTDENAQSLDHYLLDVDIIRIIKRYWKGTVDKKFYELCPEICDAFFSQPYPLLAHTELGYPLAGIKTEVKEETSGKDPDCVDMTQDSD